MKDKKQIEKEVMLFYKEHLLFHVEKLNMFPTSGTKGKLLTQNQIKTK